MISLEITSISVPRVGFPARSEDGQGPEGFLNRFPALRIVQPESYTRRGVKIASKWS